jgi:hypothetical protein
MMSPLIAMELTRWRAESLRSDGGGPRRPHRVRRSLRRALGVRLVSVGRRLIGEGIVGAPAETSTMTAGNG